MNCQGTRIYHPPISSKYPFSCMSLRIPLWMPEVPRSWQSIVSTNRADTILWQSNPKFLYRDVCPNPYHHKPVEYTLCWLTNLVFTTSNGLLAMADTMPETIDANVEFTVRQKKCSSDKLNVLQISFYTIPILHKPLSGLIIASNATSSHQCSTNQGWCHTHEVGSESFFFDDSEEGICCILITRLETHWTESTICLHTNFDEILRLIATIE